ncbi:MAG: hypothetical protein Q4D06_06770 [Coriobacteriia bacterium]|nr:hypothetical protein [Coriobacteriia bacterium]
MTSKIMNGGRNILELLLALVLLASLCLLPAAPAWAEKDGSKKAAKEQVEKEDDTGVLLLEHVDPDEVDDEAKNRINPQQPPDSSFIYDVSIADLANADSYLSGQVVQVVGEAVGDVIKAEDDPDYCWVVVASVDRGMSGNVSVYMRKTQAEAIDTLGRYGATGTMLQVRGKFNLVCKTHSGVSDIHADFVSATEEGVKNPDLLEVQDFFPGVGLAFAAIVLLLLYWFVRERAK